MPRRVRTSRNPLILALGLALVIGGCGSSSNSTSDGGGNGGGCEHWCGNGSARVSAGGVTTTITGGGCYDSGAAGIDARFGDWQGTAGVSEYLTVAGYRAGGSTPTPAPTANPLASPTATGHPNVAVSAAIAGQVVVLDTSAVVTFAPDGSGSFSGTDLNGSGNVTGTFSCS